MTIRFPKKSEKFPDPKPESKSASTSGSGFSAESMFKKFTAKLCWEQEHIEPELGELYGYYRHTCYIFLTPQCDEEYVGEGYGFYHSRMEEYDEIGRRLAKLWSIEQVTEERKINHYSRGAK